MDLYSLLIENREIIKIFYGLLIGLICLIIVLKVDKLFRLSLHQGIRYLRNAFFFYGVAFIIRYIFGALIFYEYIDGKYLSVITIIFKYFLIMAGFFLLYSLLWKKLESSKNDDYSSLFNLKIIIFYIMALVIVFLDYVWQTHYFIFISQVILFTIASGISYLNYARGKSEHKFLKFYFAAMILALAAWIFNALSALLDWNRYFLINSYLLNIIIFLLFLYGVVNATRLK
ncbi:MAG: hypothetical protein WC584_04430 [Candidatus Pacearchaeota archaeon]